MSYNKLVISDTFWLNTLVLDPAVMYIYIYTVSYTHLDVYKRQDWHPRPASAAPGARPPSCSYAGFPGESSSAKPALGLSLIHI